MHAYQPERLNDYSQDRNTLLDTMIEYPVLCAGALLSVVMMIAIFINAVWYQEGQHPSPLFSTRVIETPKKVAKTRTKAVNVQPSQEVALNQTSSDLVLSNSAELLREVQTALSVRGYYSGKLDGVYGSRTEKAITTFQSDQDMAADGKASVRLLTQILMSAPAQPQAVPVPKPKVQLAVANSQDLEQATTASTQTQAQADGLIARIQSGLRAYGYDELVVDGKMGQQTALAIQRFQLDYGMKVTGEPSDQLFSKLLEIGAYRQG